MNTEQDVLKKIKGNQTLGWLVLILGAAILFAVFWLLIKPALAEGNNDAPLLANITDVSYGSEGDLQQPRDCLACHNQPLAFHDKLGEGDQACYTCHVSTDETMKTFKLANGTVIQKDSSSLLCGQCHQERYDAWSEGTHGIPGTVAIVPCTACHNPHQPQIHFDNITKPPMPPVHTPPPIKKDWVIILGVAVGCLLVGAVVFARRREN